ncbi:AAA family ATPase [Kribbella monticola]|uniref:AAA family ATPase n=1 Tax=Kribbella monticola TaxID=2185285 RepID=UPI000DD4A181|nr:AAA family ATPase [Kribbella monticola]
MTDSHNSGHHKDREAAAAEVRRMWQPTPSWTQPDPNVVPEGVDEDVTEDEQPDALSKDYPGETWSQPAKATPAEPRQAQAQPWAAKPADPEPTAQPAHAAPQEDAAPADPWRAAKPAQAAPQEDAPSADPWRAAKPVNPPPADPWSTPAAADPWKQPAAESEAPPQQSGSGLSPAAQHFFPQGIPGQQAPQPDRPVSYRADELLQALPLPREAPAEKGVRSVLRLRPGSAERSERIARATAATAFRRPVTITVANPKGGSGKTPTTLLLAGALGQARGGGVVAWDNNELRGNMHLRTHDTNARSTVTDLLQAMTMLTQPDARLGDVGAYLRHQVSGQYDVLTSATTTYAQIEAKDFDQIHRLLSRFYKVLVIDTGNNEGSSNWREAMKASDVLVIPIKWKSLSCAAAVQMLEELDHQGPDAQRLIRRAVIAVSNGPGDVNKDVEKQLRPYFESRAAAVIDIPTDPHIAAEGPLDHSALQPATRRAALELAAKVAEQITIALNVPR